ncbi:hypothetical protein [Rhizobium sp. FKY42]|uniref:hypothetical protein n=1 Tax=Rhizobium sp. FKY42 TaxID=2562310 RepID=UPI0010C09791|nr:hypothetical protein [Rhizobium sp. FKY42]
MEASVTKGEFAALIGVSPGRVSQYLAEGKISAASLHGHGRNARIIVERAKADLRMGLDIGQRMGNGLDTRLDEDPAARLGPLGTYRGRSEADGSQPKPKELDLEIKQQKLEQLQRINRNAAITDMKAAGTLTETEASRASMVQLATKIVLTFEGGMPEIANAMAEEFKIPQRDVLHLLQREFRKLRENAAKQARKQMADLPETIETAIEVEEAETLN